MTHFTRICVEAIKKYLDCGAQLNSAIQVINEEADVVAIFSTAIRELRNEPGNERGLPSRVLVHFKQLRLELELHEVKTKTQRENRHRFLAYAERAERFINDTARTGQYNAADYLEQQS